MRTEVPVCLKCCMCVPLRYGLIVWGCLRLLLACFVMFPVGLILNRYIEIMTSENDRYKATIFEGVILSLTIIIVTADIVLGIVFIIGCCKKNVVLIKKYYQHNLFLLAILIPICIYIFGLYLYRMAEYSSMALVDKILYGITDFIGFSAYIVIQVYVVLLIRSEIVKLERGCEFRFENRVAEYPMNIVNSSEGIVGDDIKEIDEDEDIRNDV